MTSEDYDDRFMEFFGACDDSDALANLHGCLEPAAKKHAADPANRAGAKEAMEIMTGFAMARLGLDAAAIFAALYQGLCDLDNGAVPPLLAKRVLDHRPPDTGERWTLKILTAATCNILMERKQKRDAATVLVARWLNELKVGIAKTERTGAVTKTTVRNWRSEINADKRANSQREGFEKALRSAKSTAELKRGLEGFVSRLAKAAS